MRGMHHQVKYQATDPESLYSKLPVFAPSTGDLLVPLPEFGPGVCKVASREAFETLPFFPWEAVFTLVK